VSKFNRSKRVFRREPHPELFPESLESKAGPFVADLRRISEEIAGERLRQMYKPHGGVAYDPVGMFCVLMFGLMRNTSSTRELEDRVRYDVRFQYLMRGQTPDHTTISRFRQLVSGVLEDVSREVIARAQTEGLVSGRNVAVDGTKIEANTSQWRRNLQKAAAEDEAQEHADPDARPMRQRKGGTIIRGYNAQVAVDMEGDGLILACHVSNHANDAAEMHTVVENLKAADVLPETIVADAGYDSAPNHQALKDASVTGFVSPRAHHDTSWSVGEDGKVLCPIGHTPVLTRQSLKDGVSYDHYEVRECRGCPLKEACGVRKRKSISVRTSYDPSIRVANAHRCQSEEGQEKRVKRSATVERAIAHLKWNRGLGRFKMRELRKVLSEFRLHCLAHNLERLVRAVIWLFSRILGARTERFLELLIRTDLRPASCA
jgi:transposase